LRQRILLFTFDAGQLLGMFDQDHLTKRIQEMSLIRFSSTLDNIETQFSYLLDSLSEVVLIKYG